MAATCAGLGDSLAKPSCESRLLVPGLGLTEASCCLFERIWKVVKSEPRPAIHMERQLGWGHKLGGVESLGISKAGLTMLARLMEFQIWHQLASSVG